MSLMSGRKLAGLIIDDLWKWMQGWSRSSSWYWVFQVSVRLSGTVCSPKFNLSASFASRVMTVMALTFASHSAMTGSSILWNWWLPPSGGAGHQWHMQQVGGRYQRAESLAEIISLIMSLLKGQSWPFPCISISLTKNWQKQRETPHVPGHSRKRDR